MNFFFFLINLLYLFIFGCAGSSLLREGFLQLGRAGATLHCGAQASHCGGFSCCGARSLGAWASVVVAHGLSSCSSQALERRLSSRGAWAQLLHGMWDRPGPGLEPVSPALAGVFLTTEPPGKPQHELLSSPMFSVNVYTLAPFSLNKSLQDKWYFKMQLVKTLQISLSLGFKVNTIDILGKVVLHVHPSSPDMKGQQQLPSPIPHRDS